MPLNHRVIPCTCLFDWCTRLNINSYRKRLATSCSSSVLTHVFVFAISLSISQKPLFYAAPLCLILMASSNELIRTLNARALNRHTKPNLQGRAILALIKINRNWAERFMKIGVWWFSVAPLLLWQWWRQEWQEVCRAEWRHGVSVWCWMA